METIEALRVRHSKELHKLEQKDRILSLLPLDLQRLEPRVFFPSLYGAVGSLVFQHDFSRYGSVKNDVPQPTLETVKILADLFPQHETRVKVADGSLSFRPKCFVDSLAEEKKERWTSETICAPFLVDISGFQQRTMSIKWLAHTEIGLIEIKVGLPLSETIGNLDISYQDYLGGRRVKRCAFAENRERVFTLFDAEEPVAQLGSVVKWASGGDEYPNNFTLYWEPLRDDLVPSVKVLCEALA